MALSGSLVVKATGENNLIFSWGAVQDIAANRSVVSWQLLLEAGAYGRIDATPGSPWEVTVAGQAFSGTTSLAIGNNETKVLASGQVTVKHNTDGTGQFRFSFSQEFWIQFGDAYITVVTGTGSGILDTIARASTPKVPASAALGSTLTILTEPADASLTHTLEYRFGSDSGTIAQGVGDSCQWTPPVALASQIPKAVSGTAVITCTTYAGGTAIGQKEATVVLTVPETVVPTAAASVTDSTGALALVGTLVQGVSRLDVTVSGTGIYGSTITGASVTLNGKAYSGGILTDAGAVSLGVSVTDSRGRVGRQAYSLAVAAYAPPSLTLSASRCDAGGNADDTGDHARVTVSGEITAVGSNAPALKVILGGEETSVQGASFETVVAADPDETMVITAVLADKLASASRTMVLSTGYATFDLLSGGKGISLGKAATREGFDCAMPAYFSGGIYGISPDGAVDELSLTERVAALDAGLAAKAPAGLVAAHYDIPKTGTEEQLESILAAEYADMENCTERHISIGINLNGLSLPKSTALVYLSKTSGSYGTFRAICYDSTGCASLLVRNLAQGSLAPWEWENPPMQIGVEYRTTERYMGKPVYTKCINLGAMPNAATKTYTISTARKCDIRFSGMMQKSDGTGRAFPCRRGSTEIVDASVADTAIYITANTDLSGWNGYVTLWYIK